MLEITAAEYLAGYRIRVTFNTGETGTVDLEDALWGPVFEPLKDVAAFKCFTISPSFHTIVWENDADFAPEFLHEKMLEQQQVSQTCSS